MTKIIRGDTKGFPIILGVDEGGPAAEYVTTGFLAGVHYNQVAWFRGSDVLDRVNQGLLVPMAVMDEDSPAAASGDETGGDADEDAPPVEDDMEALAERYRLATISDADPDGRSPDGRWKLDRLRAETEIVEAAARGSA